MSTYHKVAQGEYITKIADRYGFGDFHAVWDHAKNAQIKQKRKSPNVLSPGDILFIPDKQDKQQTRPTARLHRFEISEQKILLRIVVKGMDGEPLAQDPCVLQVQNDLYRLTTDGSGRIEQAHAVAAATAVLTINNAQPPFDIRIPLQIGHLDPVEEISGQKARLNNLGYRTGETAGAADTDEKAFRSAIEEFQCDHGLSVDGVCGPKTQAKLAEVHGA